MLTMALVQSGVICRLVMRDLGRIHVLLGAYWAGREEPGIAVATVF